MINKKIWGIKLIALEKDVTFSVQLHPELIISFPFLAAFCISLIMFDSLKYLDIIEKIYMERTDYNETGTKGD